MVPLVGKASVLDDGGHTDGSGGDGGVDDGQNVLSSGTPLAVVFLVMVFSLSLTAFCAVSICARHFSNYHTPSVQRLALRIALLPLFFSVIYSVPLLLPHAFWLAEAAAALWDCYVVYNYFALLVFYGGGFDGCIAEITSYMQKMEFDILLHDSSQNSSINGGNAASLGYLDVDDLNRKIFSDSPAHFSFDRVQVVAVEGDEAVAATGTAAGASAAATNKFYGSTDDDGSRGEGAAMGTAADRDKFLSSEPSPLNEKRDRCSLLSRALTSLHENLLKFRFHSTVSVFSSRAPSHFARVKALILQAVFLKPAMIVLCHYLPSNPDSSLHAIHALAPALPLIVCMATLIHFFVMLYPILRHTRAKARLAAIKFVVVLLAVQRVVVEGMESTGSFRRIFDIPTFSPHSSAVRFYCLLSILEMSLLSPIFMVVFGADGFLNPKEGFGNVFVIDNFGKAFGRSDEVSCNSIEGMASTMIGEADDNSDGGCADCCGKLSDVAKVWLVLENDRGERELEVTMDSLFSDGKVLVKDRQISVRPDLHESAGQDASAVATDRETFDSFANDGEVFEV